ncbi:unnamed protein product [Nezara viridula]|uniref:Uncharacterized protein n=1 Tax=Nezara viridula TaxID=85310 RepID=A0A9P0E819_NEZVI|nr:unnamed protein product [Nezara viridula]
MCLSGTTFVCSSIIWLQYPCHPVLELGCGKGRHRGLNTSTTNRGAPRRLSTRNATTVAATAKASRWGAGGRRPNPYTTAGWWWGGSPVGSGSSGISFGVRTAY